MESSLYEDCISTVAQVLGPQVWSPHVVQGGLVASCAELVFLLYFEMYVGVHCFAFLGLNWFFLIMLHNQA